MPATSRSAHASGSRDPQRRGSGSLSPSAIPQASVRSSAASGCNRRRPVESPTGDRWAGRSDFRRDASNPWSCKQIRTKDEVMLYAFDVLVADREDLRNLPLAMRKTSLARLLARRPEGIFV